MNNLKNIQVKTAAVFVMLFLFFSSGFAQDGAKLFKQNCGACHKVDKESIGPKLKGAKAKWEDAGEGELLYEWIADPTALYNSGNSQMAKAIWEYSPAAMSAMAYLSKEEVDAIFAFADAEVPIIEEKVVEELTVAEEEGVPFTVTEKIIILIIILMLTITIWIIRDAKNALDPNRKPEEENAIAKTLTGAVEIENEESILMDHEYDGIKELDNVLPPWWVWMFYATIVFGIIYVGVYHVFKSAPLQADAYVLEMEQSYKEVEAYKLSAGMAIDENNVEQLTDAASLEKGKVLFSENCVACHGINGEGQSGPNLTDKSWIYGGDIKEVFTTIKYGTPNGMPEQKGNLNPLELQNVASFIKSLKYSEGKAPEGDKE